MPWGMGFGGRKRGRRGRRCWWYWQWNDYNYDPAWGAGYGPNWGWGRGWGGRGYGWWGYGNYYNQPYQQQYQSNITPQKSTSQQQFDINKKAEDMLSRAYLIEPFPGAPWLQIMVDSKIVGYLWEKVDLKSLNTGNPTFNGNYWSVPLLHKGKVVGYIYI